MECKICKNACKNLFKTEVLQKYQIQYFQCSSCGFIQTENPYWLGESYESAITSLDLGYVMRNLYYTEHIKDIINYLFNKKASFLDYGGGYGLFVRLMRDLGYDFFRQDNYCTNIFSQHFDIEDIKVPGQQNRFELITCFEVFEHLENPMVEIEKMLQHASSILFSTDLPPDTINNASDWHYFAPETGQHIAFYTKESLVYIAKQFNLNLFSDNRSLHLLTTKKWRFDPIKCISKKRKFYNKIRKKYFNSKHSLLYKDVDHVKQAISKKAVL